MEIAHLELALCSSKDQTSYLLALPQELLDEIAELVVLDLEHIVITRGSKTDTKEPRLASPNSRLLSLAKTSRMLYTTGIYQLYAKGDFHIWEENDEPIEIVGGTSILEEFVKQIGAKKASWITRIELSNESPIEELSLLAKLPGLQRLRISLTEVEMSRRDLRRFCDRLNNLRLEDVPSLRKLRIDTCRFCEDNNLPPSFKTWHEVEAAIDALRGLRKGGGTIEVEFLGHLTVGEDGVLEEISWRYLSPGEYTKPEIRRSDLV